MECIYRNIINTRFSFSIRYESCVGKTFATNVYNNVKLIIILLSLLKNRSIIVEEEIEDWKNDGYYRCSLDVAIGIDRGE